MLTVRIVQPEHVPAIRADAQAEPIPVGRAQRAPGVEQPLDLVLEAPRATLGHLDELSVGPSSRMNTAMS